MVGIRFCYLELLVYRGVLWNSKAVYFFDSFWDSGRSLSGAATVAAAVRNKDVVGLVCDVHLAADKFLFIFATGDAKDFLLEPVASFS